MGFASRKSPSPKRMGFSSRGFPYPMRMGFASRGSPSPKRIIFASRDSPSPQRQCFASTSLLGLDISTRPVLHLRITPLRDPFCGLLLPSIFPSKGDKEADESSLTMIIVYPQELPGCPEITLPSFVEIFRGVTDAAIPSGSLLA